MKERPVLMRGPLVRATLEDRKWMTRRVIVPQPEPSSLLEGGGWIWNKGTVILGASDGLFQEEMLKHCPYGGAGDRLWVKETWQINHVLHDTGPIPKTHPIEFGKPVDMLYRADGEFCDQFEVDEGGSRWRASMFMPRWASRLTLGIRSVRVERVQDISEEDAIAEGVDRGAEPIVSARYAFGQLWNEINAKRGYGWERNPWVWTISYTRVPASSP